MAQGKGCAERWWNTAGAELRGGELAGAGRSAATGARLGRGLVQKDERNACDPLGPRAWVGDGRSMELGGGGGLVWWCSPEREGFGHWNSLRS